MLITGLSLCASPALRAQPLQSCAVPSFDTDSAPRRSSRIDCRNTTSPDSFVFALSWSPAFCALAGDQPNHADQCQRNRYAFVVHGLWGQKRGARDKCEHPRNCDSSAVPAATVRENFCMMPSRTLIQDQWNKHGSCTGMTQKAYFDRSRSLWQRLTMPDLSQLAAQTREARLAVSAIKQAFVQANPQLTPAALTVLSGPGHTLREVQVCYDLQFRFAPRENPGARPQQMLRVVLPR